VAIRVAHALGIPCVSAVKGLEIRDRTAVAKREGPRGWEVFQVGLPAVITVKEGINLPRYPSIPGRLKAKKKPVERVMPEWRSGGLEKVRLKLPKEQGKEVEILGKGPEAAPEVVKVLRELGVIPS